MSNYVGASFDWDSDSVLIWERETAETRTLKTYKAPRYFYVLDSEGEYTSMFGEKLSKIVCDDVDDFNHKLKQYPNASRHESDIQPMFKVLMNEYYKKPNPILNYAFIDIETDTRKAVGWSTVANPYAAINAVTIYQSWTDEYITLCLAPKGYDKSKFDDEIAAMSKELNLDFEPSYILCSNETELLTAMVSSIQNADIISGWNSEFFDIPYIMQRLLRVCPRLAPKMSFIGARAPKAGTQMRFGSEEITFKLFGRTHLDYLPLFKKFAQDVRYPSYSLGFVGEAEVGVGKVHFDGHFEDFYNNEFAKFVCYNARDVDILVKINKKRKLFSLVNTMAHENTCLFENLMGTVRYVETAIVNRAHHIHNKIVRDSVVRQGGDVVDGALVLDPFAGLWEWLGSVDINSLYPSVIRALNISPEMIIGTFISGNCSDLLKTNGSHFVPQANNQLPRWKADLVRRNFDRKNPNRSPNASMPTNGEYDWAGIMEGDSFDHTLQLTSDAARMLGYDDTEITATGAEWLEIFKVNKWALSAYGTVFDQSRGLGIIAAALEAWYAERKEFQKQKAQWIDKVIALKKQGAPQSEIDYAEAQVEDFEMLQMSKKLTLNSTYGAMLSPYFGLGREEMGASVTACGRAITKHMIEEIGRKILGMPVEITWYYGYSKNKATTDQDSEFAENAKRTSCFVPKTQSICDVTLLSDTDSCYFRTLKTTKAEAIKEADEIAEYVNGTFPQFMRDTFMCSSEKFDTLIKAGREVVGRRGLFLDAKKKYTIRVIDLDGKPVWKLKMMGSELKKVDTPKVIQDFLKGLMGKILDGDETIQERYDAKEISIDEAIELVSEATELQLEKFVNKKRKDLVFRVENPITLGAAKGINNLDAYYAEWTRTEKANMGKVTLPGHVRAAINYNEIVNELEGKEGKMLKSGDKGLIFYLKPNHYGLKSIAIPVDFEHFPKWFDEHFTLDRRLTEQKMIDSKIEGIYHALGWQIPNPQLSLTKKILRF
jgi:DNA polymerase elongation subunit (family B)